MTLKRDSFALTDVNIHIEKGKKYAVIGQSGAGKSTLLKMIMGYIKPDAGVITIVMSLTCQN